MARQREQGPKQAKPALQSDASEGLPLPARAYVDMALEFANQVYAGSVAEAERVFWSPLGIRFEVQGDGRPMDRLRGHQRRIREMLAQISREPGLSPAREREINRWLGSEVQVRIGFAKSRITSAYLATSVTAAAALGVALLFELELAGRLRECEHCGRFFLAEGKRHRARFCPGECAEMNRAEKNAERQRRFQQRKKEQER